MINDVGEEIQEVRYGEVFGIKCISTTGPARSKRLDYALTVPGGYAIALLYPPSINSDEQQIEAYFHTIKVLNYPPAARPSYDRVG